MQWYEYRENLIYIQGTLLIVLPQQSCIPSSGAVRKIQSACLPAIMRKAFKRPIPHLGLSTGKGAVDAFARNAHPDT